MIEVLRGSVFRVRSEILERFHRRPEASLWLESPDDSHRSWDGVRNLLAQIRPRVDEATWARCVDRRRPAVGLVLDGLPVADDEERRAREPLRARLDSYLSHNWTLQRPLVEAWAGFLVDLSAGRGWTLCVPHLAQVDWKSHAVLAAIYRLHLDRAPDLVVGFDPSPRSAGVDERGIRWGKVPGEQLYLAGLGFHMRPEATVRSLDEGEGEAEASSETWNEKESPVAVDDAGWVEGVETAVFARLASGEKLDEALCMAAFEAMEACFARFAFTTVLRLGLELLERGAGFEPERAAKLHGMIALSAHNRQFRSGGNRELAPFLEDHLRRAYALERDPGHRIALCYRMAVTLGRRMGRIEPAIEWADRGIELARAAPLPELERLRHEAWCLNIRAFLWMRHRRLDNAIADDVRAFELLREAEVKAPEWPRELSSTQGVLAHNTAALYTLAKDLDRVGHWRAVAGEIEKHHPGTETWEAHAWIGYCRNQLRLDEALSRAESGLESARAEREPFHEYHYTLMLADLSYRLGDAEAALRWFDRAGELRRRCGDPEYLVSPHLSAAWAARRAGRLDAAVARFEEVLAGVGVDPALRVELLGALGEIAAQRGRVREAEKLVDEAISRAVDTGERDLLLRAAVVAAGACRALGRDTDAATAYRRALEIVKTDGVPGEPGEPLPPAGDLLRALVGLAELGPTEGPDRRELTLRALAVLERALHEDAEAWWVLPRLAELADQVGAAAAPALRQRPDLVVALELLRDTAGQRRDWERDVQEKPLAAAG